MLWGTERTVRGQFHKQRNEDYHCWDSVEQGMEEITLCSGHSNSGILVNKDTETTVPGLFAAGDCAAVPQQYLTGAFVFGAIAGRMAAEYAARAGRPGAMPNPEQTWQEVSAPLKIDDDKGLPVEQVETKIRTKVSQYLTPPKSDPLMNKMLWWVDRIRREDLPNVKVCDYHDLIRATEVTSITDCAEMAARASLFRTESRWGLSHYRLACPERKAEWDRQYVIVKKNMSSGEMECENPPTSGITPPASNTNTRRSTSISVRASCIRRTNTPTPGSWKSTTVRAWKFPSASSPRWSGSREAKSWKELIAANTNGSRLMTTSA